MRSPSGDHSGHWSERGSDVTRLFSQRVVSTRKMSILPPTVSKRAMREPSGESSGELKLPDPRLPALPTSLPDRSNHASRLTSLAGVSTYATVPLEATDKATPP